MNSSHTGFQRMCQKKAGVFTASTDFGVPISPQWAIGDLAFVEKTGLVSGGMASGECCHVTPRSDGCVISYAWSSANIRIALISVDDFRLNARIGVLSRRGSAFQDHSL
jgi:hypothetical protein